MKFLCESRADANKANQDIVSDSTGVHVSANVSDHKDGMTPLRAAVLQRLPEVAQLLVEAGSTFL